MKRTKLEITAWLLLSLSVIWFICNAYLYAQRLDWVKTTAVIDFVALPGGYVMGTFTDIHNAVHEDVLLYQDISIPKGARGATGSTESYIGKAVRIMYDPDTGLTGASYKIESYDKMMQAWLLSLMAVLVSMLFLVVGIKMKKSVDCSEYKFLLKN